MTLGTSQKSAVCRHTKLEGPQHFRPSVISNHSNKLIELVRLEEAHVRPEELLSRSVIGCTKGCQLSYVWLTLHATISAAHGEAWKALDATALRVAQEISSWYAGPHLRGLRLVKEHWAGRMRLGTQLRGRQAAHRQASRLVPRGRFHPQPYEWATGYGVWSPLAGPRCIGHKGVERVQRVG